MQKLAVGLALSTLAFAISTFHFWHELEAERARHVSPTTGISSQSAPKSPVAAAAPAATTAVPSAREVVRMNAGFSAQTTSAGDPAQSREAAFLEAKRRAAQQAPAFLARYNSAQGRAELVKEYRRMVEASSSTHAADVGLDDDAYGRLMDTLAENALAAQEQIYRCALEEQCRFPGGDRSLYDAQRRDLISMFGADVVEKFEFHESSGGERRLVGELRGRLPDSARLTDAQTDALIRALYEENRSIGEDIAKLGGNVGSYNYIVYVQMDSNGATGMNDAARELNQRLYHRAASVLTDAQLKMYQAMQTEAIEQIERRSRQN